MRYFVGSLVAIFLFIVILVIIFGGGSSKPNGPQPINPVSLAKTDNKVVFIIEGEVNADKAHRKIRLVIDGDSSRLEVIKGYSDNVVVSHRLDNSRAAYTTFLHALRVAGFSNGKLKATQDERGQCPLGYRYLYEIIGNNGNIRQKLWSSSCGVGTMEGSASTIRQLFQKQFPKYAEWTGDVDLSI